MKKKTKIVIIVTIIGILLLGIGVGILYSFPISFSGKSVDIPKPLASDTMLTLEQVEKDRNQAIAYKEQGIYDRQIKRYDDN